MPDEHPRQVVLFPEQLNHLAEQFPDGGAVAISQNGSVVTAFNGTKRVIVDASGDPLDHSSQETYPQC